MRFLPTEDLGNPSCRVRTLGMLDFHKVSALPLKQARFPSGTLHEREDEHLE